MKLPYPVEYYAWLESGEYEDYILPNNKIYPAWIPEQYSEYALTETRDWNCDEQQDEDLFPYQRFVADYLSFPTPYRGVLLFYGLGSGKTRSALQIAKEYRLRSPKTNVVFISPASLADNLIQEMGKWGIITNKQLEIILAQNKKQDRDALLAQYGYYTISYNAPNKIQQLKRQLTDGKLRDSIIIVDEIHNMAQFIHNGLNQTNRSKKESALEFYNILYGATNCRFIFLSGTPIINSPSELSVLFNILRGPMRYRKEGKELTPIPKSVRDNISFHEAFPLSAVEFNKIFVNWSDLEVKKADLFKRRIMGLVSYYAGARGDVYPDILNDAGQIMTGDVQWTLVGVPMSRYQLGLYEEYRNDERKKSKKDTAGVLGMDIKNIEMTTDLLLHTSSYRTGSRQASNFALPPELISLRPKSITKDPELLEVLYDELDAYSLHLDEREDIFSKELLEEYSPKMLYMLNEIERTMNSPKLDGNILVYSNYRSVEGVELFARVLENHGFEYYWNPVKSNKPKFAILGTDHRLRGQNRTTHIINVFNSPANVNGELIKLVLGTANISEGISLFNIRLVQIMEPHWNMVRVNQVIGRARRICSHRMLPKDKWNFRVFIYLSVLPPHYRGKDSISTDEVLYEIARRKEIIKEKFIHLIKESAIDCVLNATHNQNLLQNVKCLSFTDEGYTYYPNIYDDMGIATPPTSSEQEIKWTPFEVPAQVPAKVRAKFYKTDGAPKYAVLLNPDNSRKYVRVKLLSDQVTYPALSLYDSDELETNILKLMGYVLQGKPLINTTNDIYRPNEISIQPE